MTNKEVFLAYIDKYVKKRNVTKLKVFLEESDFFVAPASTKYHSNFEEGLCIHSIYVLKRLFYLYKDYKLRAINDEIRKQAEAYKQDCLAKGITPTKEFALQNRVELTEDECESLTLMALCHDLCKANFYKLDTKNKKIDGAWVSVPFYMVDEKVPLGHGEKSVILLLRLGVELTDDEIFAIRYHMGDFAKEPDTSKAYRNYPVALLLHIADMQASYLDEEIHDN